jgi:hypothetical protein
MTGLHTTGSGKSRAGTHARIVIKNKGRLRHSLPSPPCLLALHG